MRQRGWFRRRRGPLLAGLVAVTAAVACVVAPQASYAGQAPVTTTIGSSEVDLTFNDPVDHGGEDTTQLDKMIALINGAPSGSSIRMAVYSITANIVYDAIKAAVDRGVHVYVVHNGEDQSSSDSTPQDLATLLGANHHWCDHGSSSLVYGGGCISTSSTGLMHAKYMLFSQTTDAGGALRSWVTWFGSPNETYASGADLFNNSLTVYGDQTLYDNFYNDLWLPQWQEASYPNNDFYVASAPRGYFGSSASNTQVYASPEQDTDLVANRLSYINPDSNCRIRVMEASINDTRSAVVNELVSLHQNGCQIWVDTGSIQSQSLSALKAAGIPVHTSPVHDKAIIIYGRYNGSTADRPVILTGSHNLTESALRYNDEILVKVEDSQPLYNAFYNHFNDAYNTGTAL
jgi:phosphatidylserine/phosphatidylglycerophosphate/cardiolipin synthase-like enzyme